MLDARYLSLVPVILLMGGAFILGLGGESMGHHTKYVTSLAIVSVALISLAYLLFLPQPYETTLFPWLNLRQFPLTFSFRGDGLSIYPSLFAMGALLFLILFGWAASLVISAGQLALMLASLAAFVQLLLSGNLLLLYLAGEVLVFLMAAQIQPSVTEYISQGAQGLFLGFNQLAGFGLLIVVLLAGLDWGSFAISSVALITLGLGSYLLLVVVVAVKSGLYPFDFWLSAAFAKARAPGGGLLIILAPLSGIYLLARFTFMSGLGPNVEIWLLTLACLSAVLLPFFAFEDSNPNRSLAYLVAAQGAFAVVALAVGAHASLWRHMLSLAVGAVWLYLGLLALGKGQGSRGGLVFWLTLLGGASLLGLPSPTIGFVARWELFNALWGKGHFLGLALGLLSQAISLAVLWRILAQGLDNAPDVRQGRWQPALVMLLLNVLGIVLGVIPGMVDNYVTTPALASLTLARGPEPAGVIWNLGLMALAIPVGLLLERHGSRRLPGWGTVGTVVDRVVDLLDPVPLFYFAGKVLVTLSQLLERWVNLIPEHRPLTTALMIGIFILLFMMGST